MSSCESQKMQESDIRDNDDIDYRKSLYKQDQKNILKHKHEFVVVDCPACKGANRHLFYKRDGFEFQQCSDCGTVYVSPRPTSVHLQEHYTNSLAEKYWSEHVYPRFEKKREKNLIEPRVDKIVALFLEYSGDCKDIAVDIGAGPGTFACCLKEKKLFKKIIAVDSNPVNAQICADKGLEVINSSVEEMNKPIDADLVTSFECIEHVFSPEKYIEIIYGMLRVNGLLVITTPNILGFDLCVLRDISDNTTAPDHLNYFHPESLKLLLENKGFEVVEMLTPGKLDVELVRSKVLEQAFSLDSCPFLKRIVVDDFDGLGHSFQKWLSENMLSSHLWVIARKT